MEEFSQTKEGHLKLKHLFIGMRGTLWNEYTYKNILHPAQTNLFNFNFLFIFLQLITMSFTTENCFNLSVILSYFFSYCFYFDLMFFVVILNSLSIFSLFFFLSFFYYIFL